MYNVINQDDSEEDSSKRNLLVEPKYSPRSLHSNGFIEKFSFGLLLATSVVIVVVFVLNTLHQHNSDDISSVLSQCFRSPSCTASYESLYNHETGFTNNTGWSTLSEDSCCNICLPGTTKVTCSGSTCDSKKGVIGDYDYILLDQIWLPQWCNALQQGHDPTLSHLSGSSCNSPMIATSSKLGIHGLWPNYFGGFPQCCGDGQDENVSPLDISSLSTLAIYETMQSEWLDPTNSFVNCSVCYLWNHEWQKHGGCFSSEPEVYFWFTLNLTSILSTSSAAVESMSGQIVKTEMLTNLYEVDVNLICDPNDAQYGDNSVGTLLEIQTCWRYREALIAQLGVPTKEKILSSSSPSIEDYEMFDCPPASVSTFTKPCPSLIWISNSSSWTE